MRNPTDPIFYGMLGELAFANWINRFVGRQIASPDFALRSGGDGGIDFDLGGVKIDIKCQGRLSQLRVRRMDNGRMLPLASDVYVAALTAAPKLIQLLGWTYRRDIERFSKSPVPGATHWNVEVPLADLLPMGRLGKKIEAGLRKGAICR